MTDRFPDSELTDYLNHSIARLYTLLDRFDVSYYRTSTTITTQAQKSLYDLPANFGMLKSVVVNLGSTTSPLYIKARKFGVDEGPWLQSIGAWVSAIPIYYRLAGKDPFSGVNKDAGLVERIEFAPIPGGNYSVLLDYVKTPQSLTAPSDEFDGQMGFEEWAVLDCAIKIKRKNRVDASDLMADKVEVETWIQSLGGAKDQSMGETMQDVQSDYLHTWPWG